MFRKLFALIMILSLLLAACATEATEEPAPAAEEPAAEEPVAEEPAGRRTARSFRSDRAEDPVGPMGPCQLPADPGSGL